MIPVNASLKHTIYGAHEIVAVSLDMKSDEICTQQPIQQILLPRAYAEGVRIGPGYMPEDGDSGVRHPFLDHAGKQREVVILDEDDRTAFGGDLLRKRIGESSVDLLVELPIRHAKDRAHVCHMTQRP